MVAVRIRTHILTTQPSQHKSNALNRSAMTLHDDTTCHGHDHDTPGHSIIFCDTPLTHSEGGPWRPISISHLHG